MIDASLIMMEQSLLRKDKDFKYITTQHFSNKIYTFAAFK